MLDHLIASLTPQRLQTKWRQTFQALNNRDFRLYQLGQLISNAGTFMQNVALSWIVYKLTGSALALGLVQFASNLPLLLLTYFGGVVADRVDRRKLIIVTQWLDMSQAIVITILYMSGMLTVPWLIGLAIYLGISTAFETPARQAFVPDLVNKSELTNAIGLNSAIFNATRLIGPVLAGLILATGGEMVCFIANAASYIAAIVTLHMIRAHASHSSPATGSEGASAGTADGTTSGSTSRRAPSGTTAELMAWAKQSSILPVYLMVGATSLFGFWYSVLVPVIAAQTLHGNGATVGYLSAASGIGALLGSLLVATKAKPNRSIIGTAALGLGVGIGLMAFSQTLWMSLIAMAVAGLCMSLQFGGSNTYLQTNVPANLRGRAMSIYAALLMGLSPFAALFAGWLAQGHGVMLTLATSAVGMGIAAIAYLVHLRKS